MRTALVVIVLAALACCVGFVANTFDHRAVEWLRIWLATLGVAPLLPALVLLLMPQRYPAGVAYVAGGGLVGALVLALPAGLMLLLIGLASGPAQRNDTLLLAGYELCLIALFVAGIIAFVRQAGGERAWGALFTSVLLVAGYAGFVIWLADTGKLKPPPYNRQDSIGQHNDASARKTVIRIADCARRHAQTHPKEGYPATLAALEGCVGKRFASRGGARAGAIADDYLVFYFADPPDENGTSRRFAVCARPVEPGVGGKLVIGVNPAGTVAERPTSYANVPTCFDVWAGDDAEGYLEALSACLLSIASLAPQKGYPEWFNLGGDVPDTGVACGMPLREGANGRIVSPRGVFEYLPELPDAKGRVSRYLMYLYPGDGRGGALSIDQTGAIHEGLFPGVAPTLEAIEASRPFEQEKTRRVAARRETLARDCRGGDLETCDALGDFEWDHNEPEAARGWWDYACEHGRLMSCMFTSRYSVRLDTYPAQRDKERCKAGEKRYCERLQHEFELQRAELEKMRASGGRQSAVVRGNLAPPSGAAR